MSNEQDNEFVVNAVKFTERLQRKTDDYVLETDDYVLETEVSPVSKGFVANWRAPSGVLSGKTPAASSPYEQRGGDGGGGSKDPTGQGEKDPQGDRKVSPEESDPRESEKADRTPMSRTDLGVDQGLFAGSLNARFKPTVKESSELAGYLNALEKTPRGGLCVGALLTAAKDALVTCCEDSATRHVATRLESAVAVVSFIQQKGVIAMHTKKVDITLQWNNMRFEEGTTPLEAFSTGEELYLAYCCVDERMYDPLELFQKIVMMLALVSPFEECMFDLQVKNIRLTNVELWKYFEQVDSHSRVRSARKAALEPAAAPKAKPKGGGGEALL
jgi:hypothetical protein